MRKLVSLLSIAAFMICLAVPIVSYGTPHKGKAKTEIAQADLVSTVNLDAISDATTTVGLEEIELNVITLPDRGGYVFMFMHIEPISKLYRKKGYPTDPNTKWRLFGTKMYCDVYNNHKVDTDTDRNNYPIELCSWRQAVWYNNTYTIS